MSDYKDCIKCPGLKAERDRWQKRWIALGDNFDKEVPALREENARLREALEMARPTVERYGSPEQYNFLLAALEPSR